MANADQTMHYDIATPRLVDQQGSGRPHAEAETPETRGELVPGNMHVLAGTLRAEGDLLRGNVQRLDGAGGDSSQYRPSLGAPSNYRPIRDRSVTPRRGGPLVALRSGS